MHGVQPGDLDFDLAGCAASHGALVDHLRSLDEIGVGSPSRLPGWTVGHVLTHLARNADSYMAMLAGRDQYDGAWDGRDAEISKGASRTWGELVEDLANASHRLEATFASFTGWTNNVATLIGPHPARLLPLHRRREVEVHRVDLGLGHEFADIPGDYIERDLRVLETWWISEQPSGTAELPASVGRRSPLERWTWLVGRTAVEGVKRAKLF